MAVFYVLILLPMMIQHFVIKKDGFSYEKKNKIALTVFFVLFIAMHPHTLLSV